MSVCSDCHTTNPVARCLTALTIGSISSLSTDVFVYIENIATGRIVRYSATSDATGKVIIQITPQQFSENMEYEGWITKRDAGNIEVRESIVIGAESQTCAYISFQNVITSDNTNTVYASQTLTI